LVQSSGTAPSGFLGWRSSVREQRDGDAAVLDGTGVAVAQFPYVSDALAAGRLVSPFPIVASKRENWLLEYRSIRQEEPALIAFRNWLRGEAEKQNQAEAELLRQSKTKSTAAV
jgi:LysR family transcriptional regulator, regulator of gene expression of beta-lactamase